jgi:hypothetical protein
VADFEFGGDVMFPGDDKRIISVQNIRGDEGSNLATFHSRDFFHSCFGRLRLFDIVLARGSVEGPLSITQKLSRTFFKTFFKPLRHSQRISYPIFYPNVRCFFVPNL